ncbi:MAG: 4-deoxy-4-formamido-L-arabinose-phosphoundecaprenol deformylase, partial [Desulfuromonadales bacterium]|nr:4-deoxy-4-formamido-L-arabinose-phosphoundecaprenol deformylase [Desulfuromonadales bacterium]
ENAVTTAAPGWTISENSLDIQDSMGLLYCSDSRGTSPFYPVINNHKFNTIQIPTTWPTMDELLGENGITVENINNHYLSLLKPGLNVHTIHTEMEGKSLASIFKELIEKLVSKDIRFVTLEEAAMVFKESAPACPVEMGTIAGRAGYVALQRENCE